MESAFKEELELVRHSSVLRFQGLLMPRAYDAWRSGDWKNYLEEFRRDGRLSFWASIKVNSEGGAEHDGRFSICAGHFCVKVRIS